MEKNWRINGYRFERKGTYGDDDDKYINTEIKTYQDSIITNFYDKAEFKEVPERKIPHKCLSIIMLDSVLFAYKSDSNNNKQNSLIQ